MEQTAQRPIHRSTRVTTGPLLQEPWDELKNVTFAEPCKAGNGRMVVCDVVSHTGSAQDHVRIHLPELEVKWSLDRREEKLSKVTLVKNWSFKDIGL